MKNKKIIPLLLGSAAFTSQAVFAHPGHDHNAASSNLIHLLWIAPALIAVGLIAYKLVNKNKQAKKD
ncbi:hypothetical protein CJF42_16990 [Pseudoalteromonas sp. NBT06-2]|uniref:hypothetical protein n=1 Tax=Pseudoalteromonas sp. NBT06-2 TaxID=2025950 RepID=UPI000BA71660|nr:hypothetical protein [Pseudoalteromonas sp. NBT06-2]PAJ73204.1 hypothetical protein CJF42_16990 [Pseudoalteromonas sp. NBT06-2]